MPVVMLNEDYIKSARKKAAAKEDVEYIDRQQAGFMIRVRSGRAMWYEKAKATKTPIAPLDTYGEKDLPILRQLVSRIKEKRAAGWPKEDIEQLVTEFNRAPYKGVDHADNEANSVDWKWERLREAFLEDMKTMGNSRSYGNHRSFLGAVPNSVYCRDLKPLSERKIKNISVADIKACVNNVLERGKSPVEELKTRKRRDGMYNTARLVQESIKGCLRWGYTNRQTTGLMVDPTISLQPVAREVVKVGQLKPEDVHKMAGLIRATPEEIKSLPAASVIVERPYLDPKEIFEFLEWLDICEKKRTYPVNVIRVLRIQALTGQRISTVCSMLRAMVRRVDDEEFHIVWYLGPDKNGKYRALPLPSYAGTHAFKAVASFDENAENLRRTVYLFSKSRSRIKGDNMNIPLGKEQPTGVLLDARAPGGPFHSSKVTVSSHQFRRAFVSNLRNRWKLFGFSSKEATDKITHRNEGMISTSDLFYNYDPDFEEKYLMLKVWQDLILMNGDYYDAAETRAMLVKGKKRRTEPTAEEIAADKALEEMYLDGELN